MIVLIYLNYNGKYILATEVWVTYIILLNQILSGNYYFVLFFFLPYYLLFSKQNAFPYLISLYLLWVFLAFSHSLMNSLLSAM